MVSCAPVTVLSCWNRNTLAAHPVSRPMPLKFVKCIANPRRIRIITVVFPTGKVRRNFCLLLPEQMI